MPKLIYDEQKLIEKLIKKVALHPLEMTQADIIPLDRESHVDGTGLGESLIFFLTKSSCNYATPKK